jgi:hypothetical protein
MLKVKPLPAFQRRTTARKIVGRSRYVVKQGGSGVSPVIHKNAPWGSRGGVEVEFAQVSKGPDSLSGMSRAVTT